jgi:hypothetical protein
MDENFRPDDEIDLLDLLVTVAESWKLLVIAPFLVACSTFLGVSLFVKPTFESVATIRATPAELALLKTPIVLAPLLKPYGYLNEDESSVDRALLQIAKDLTFSHDKQTGLATVRAKADSPDQAQSFNRDALNGLMFELIPKGLTKLQIETDIATLDETIASSRASLSSIRASIAKGQSGADDDLTLNISSLLSIIQNSTRERATLERSLRPRAEESILQPSTLPQDPMPRKRAMYAAVAALASGFALLLFVFIRQALSSADANPESAAKLARIRQALGWRASKA